MTASTQVLAKLFAYRFYKAHSGLLLFFFVTVLISFFFVNVLNETHLTEEGRIEQNLALTLAFISSPIFTAFIFCAWLAYMAKSWSFIAAQLRLPQHQFLFYSFNARTKSTRWLQWLYVQAIITLPLLTYGLFALVVGTLYGHYQLPVVILLYIAVLMAAGASVCIQLDQLFIDDHAVPWTMRMTRRWPKPFFMLPFFHLLHRQKITLVVTKILSASILASGVFLFPEETSDCRIMGILALGLATAHAFTIRQIHGFYHTYLTFWRNFPYAPTRRMAQTAMAMMIFVMPELVWMLLHNTPWNFAQAFVLVGGVMMLYSSLLHDTTPTSQYLMQVFYVFIVCFILILFNLVLLLAPLVLLVGIVRYRRAIGLNTY